MLKLHVVDSRDEQFIVDLFAAVKEAGYRAVRQVANNQLLAVSLTCSRVVAWMERTWRTVKKEWHMGVPMLNIGANDLLMSGYPNRPDETVHQYFLDGRENPSKIRSTPFLIPERRYLARTKKPNVQQPVYFPIAVVPSLSA